MPEIRVNFKLYKAVALLNLRYDDKSYKEGEELSIRETDIEELETKKKYVEMKERPAKEAVNVTPPGQQNNITPPKTTTPPNPTGSVVTGTGTNNGGDGQGGK